MRLKIFSVGLVGPLAPLGGLPWDVWTGAGILLAAAALARVIKDDKIWAELRKWRTGY